MLLHYTKVCNIHLYQIKILLTHFGYIFSYLQYNHLPDILSFSFLSIVWFMYWCNLNLLRVILVFIVGFTFYMSYDLNRFY